MIDLNYNCQNLTQPHLNSFNLTSAAFGFWNNYESEIKQILISLASSNFIGLYIKGSVWESDKLILNDGRWFPETADVIFFSEKFVF